MTQPAPAECYDRLAEDAEYDARCEQKVGNYASAKTERDYAAGYHEAARALRAAAKPEQPRVKSDP